MARLSLRINNYSYLGGKQHQVIGYLVVGLPAGEHVTINNAMPWEKAPAWKIVSSKNGLTKELEGEYRTADAALAALEKLRLA